MQFNLFTSNKSFPIRFIHIHLLLLLFLLLQFFSINAADGNQQQPQLPTLYQYYTSGGIHSGLEANNDNHFTLNGKPLVIYSGTFHYFRVVPEYWPIMLRRYKAAGLNAVQFYLPWNQHEDVPDRFDFGTQSPFLNVEKFLQLIHQEDMFAIVRPGPYICGEWEFGGLPSWLLHDRQMSLRSNYEPYRKRVKLYWDKVMEIINRYQFWSPGSKGGGPVIMLQLENEYSQYLSSVSQSRDYLRYLYNITKSSGFNGLLFTSDPGDAAVYYPTKGIFDHNTVLETANTNKNLRNLMRTMKQHQPGKPAYVSEFWSGWFDQWNGGHRNDYNVTRLSSEMSDTLFQSNASLNLYPFLGGTNWGFMNAQHVTTSWDFDAPLTISGNYTAKYYITLELYEKLVTSGRHPKIQLPPIPPAPVARVYKTLKVEKMLPLDKVLQHYAIRYDNAHEPEPMEWLPEGKDHGQRYGFALYRVEGSQNIRQYEIIGKFILYYNIIID